MGSPKAHTYLASPGIINLIFFKKKSIALYQFHIAVVAASAIKGYICGPEALGNKQVSKEFSYKVTKHAPVENLRKSSAESSCPGFETHIKGEVVFCDQDNLNTDGIYPGKYTYQDDLTPEKMAQVVMENYDPKFSQIIKTVL